MSRFGLVLSVVTLLVSGWGGAVWAQDTAGATPDSTEAWYEDAWTPIVERDGVQFSYIFYSNADNRNNGVVIRLRNENDMPVRYGFTVIFRGPKGEATAQAEGTLGPGETKTGEKDGLFWIPFRDGRSIGEVGLRGIDVTAIPEVGS